MSLSKAALAEIAAAVAAILGGPAATAAPQTKARKAKRAVDPGTPGATYRVAVSPIKPETHVELFFSAKPTETVRKALKSAGFGFSANGDRGPRWYGRRADLANLPR